MPSTDDLLAARSLIQGAGSLLYIPKPPGQALRMVALSQMGYRLDPTDAESLLRMADIYQSQQKEKQAAQMLQALLAIHPNSYALATRWMQNTLKSLDTSGYRLASLRAVAEDASAPDPVRADACYRMSAIYQAQAQKDDAAKAVDRALELDPWHVSSLGERFRLKSNPTALDYITVQLNILRGHPRNIDAAWKMGQMAGGMGLYDHSMNFFTFTQMLMYLKGADDPRKEQRFTAEYFSAVLDLLQSKRDRDGAQKLAGQIEQAAKKFPQSVDLKGLLMETYLAIEQKDKADEIAKAMKASYDERIKTATMTSDLADEIAWFHIVTMPDAKLALKYAQQAFKINDKSPTVLRVLGVAELMSDDEDVQKQGEARLRKLTNIESFAGVFLAEHYERKGNPEGLAGAMEASASLGRSGPAFRRLQDLRFRMEKQGKKLAALSEVPDFTKAKAVLDQFDARVLQLLSAPNQGLSITIAPVKDKILPGEPVELEATLTNIGPVPLPIGDPGLFNPVMEIVVRAGGEKDGTLFFNLPVFSWQAPRYLMTNQSLKARVRLDIGTLGQYLAARPFEEISLTVQGVLDAEARGNNLISSLPTMKIETITFTRSNLLTMVEDFKPDTPASWKPAYETVLGTITQKQILRGDLTQRMLAARQVNSLLSAARHNELGDVKLPAPLATVVRKDVIQAMLQALIKDKSPAVRAEAVATTPEASMDQVTTTLLSLLMDDPSPMVRLWVLSTLGTADMKGKDRLLEKYSKDPDEIVQNLAQTLAK